MQSPMRKGMATLAVVVTGALASAASADAFAHNWTCSSAASVVQCYDYQGQQYVDWAKLSAYVPAGAPNVCSKSITAAGNVRSAGNVCTANSTFDVTCYTYRLPESWAYVYWSGSGGNRQIDGRADQTYCD